MLHAATLVAQLPGCEMWLVDRDQANPETIRVSEIWASQEQSDAAAQIGSSHYRLLPNRRQGWAHRHAVAEEIYVTLNDSGRVIVDEQSIDLVPLVAVRIAPASARELEAGPDGLEVLAFGSHSPGDGEMAAAS